MLGFGTTSTDSRSIVVGEITRPYDRATAVGVMKTKVVGKAKTRAAETEITAADLENIKTGLKAGRVYEGVPELQGPGALDRVSQLDAYLAPRKVGPKGDGTIPDFLIDALWSEPHKQAAKLIAGKFGKIPAKQIILDNGALKQAVALLDKPAELARAFMDGNRKPLWGGSLTDFSDKIRDLREFMAHGTNGLANHGPAYINGEAFYCVIPLPELRGIPRPSNNRPEEERQQMNEDIFNKMIAHYDPGFAECGYDRVYIQSEGEKPEDSRLFVALRDRGELKNITYNDRVSFVAKSADQPTVAAWGPRGGQSLTGDVGEIRLTGRVLWKNDVPNTRRESATTFVKNLVRSTIRRHREKYNPPPTLPGLGPTGGNPISSVGIGPGPAPFIPVRPNPRSTPTYNPGGLLGAGGGVVGLTAFTGAMAASSAYFTFQNMLTAAIATGVITLVALAGTVLAFEVERAVTPKSINPVLNAAGLSVQGKRLLAEEF